METLVTEQANLSPGCAKKRLTNLGPDIAEAVSAMRNSDSTADWHRIK